MGRAERRARARGCARAQRTSSAGPRRGNSDIGGPRDSPRKRMKCALGGSMLTCAQLPATLGAPQSIGPERHPLSGGLSRAAARPKAAQRRANCPSPAPSPLPAAVQFSAIRAIAATRSAAASAKMDDAVPERPRSVQGRRHAAQRDETPVIQSAGRLPTAARGRGRRRRPSCRRSCCRQAEAGARALAAARL